jgi:hypothetical protein
MKFALNIIVHEQREYPVMIDHRLVVVDFMFHPQEQQQYGGDTNYKAAENDRGERDVPEKVPKLKGENREDHSYKGLK